jgi:glutamine---fructose-6-phosphate transaminase (isomerizing)
MPMSSPLPVYQDILNQGKALQQALDYQLGPGRKALERSAHAVRDASKVRIASIGASYSASLPFQYRLQASGKQVDLVDASELLHYTNPPADPGTVFILVSRSGETIEIVRLLDVLKGRGAPIIGITNEPGSPLARLSDIPLLLGSPRDSLIAIQTYLSTLLAFHLLAEFVSHDPTTVELNRSIHNTIGLVKSTIDEYRQVSQRWAENFRRHTGVYLLARGASRASANQAALLFHEMARYPASAWTIGEFRHGPWEVIDDRICTFVFMPDDQTRQLNQAFVGDLVDMGGHVHLVSSSPIETVPNNSYILSMPRVDPYLAPLLEIIPLQFYIYEYALWLGLTPGVFRASTPITLSETGSFNSSP